METKFFLKVCGSQRPLNRPQFSHTYAVFTRREINDDGSSSEWPTTISWLPRDGDINPFGPPEPGRNYSLRDTRDWLDANFSFVRWESPEVEIERAFYDSALERVRELQSGTVLYKMIDNFILRPHKATNCIHAVTDIPVAIQKLGMAYTGTLHGNMASRFVFQYLSPFFLQAAPILKQTEEEFDAEHAAWIEREMAMSSFVEMISTSIEEAAIYKSKMRPAR